MSDLLPYVRNAVDQWFTDNGAEEHFNYQAGYNFVDALKADNGLDLPDVGTAFYVDDYDKKDYHAKFFVVFKVEDELFRIEGESDSWEGGYPEWEPLYIQKVEAYEVTKTKYKVVR